MSQVFESNPLPKGHHNQHYGDNYAGKVNWADPNLAKIIRLRLLSDPGFPFWDVSYCHGVLKDGRTCDVYLPFSQLPKRLINVTIIKYAMKDGVYAKGLGIFGAISCLC